MMPIGSLQDLVENLADIDPEMTIYAVEPWTGKSRAVVAMEPEEGGLPEEAVSAGAAYFLEVFLALDFLDDWRASLDHEPSDGESCERLIQYAIADA